MRVVYSATHQLLDPKSSLDAGVPAGPPDAAARAEAIVSALRADDGFVIEDAVAHGLEPIEAVHSRGLIDFLETAWDLWTAAGHDTPLFPDTVLHQLMRDGMGKVPEPEYIVARMGYHCFDTYTPIVAGTYPAARAAVDVALTATDLVLGGEQVVYGLCRPPGHHAGFESFGGSSYLNSAAIAAEHVARTTAEPVAVLDLDYHHGNGTQQIFYERGDVRYVSIHGDPARAYPYFSGHASEVGVGAGEGATRNLPLPSGCDDSQYMEAFTEGLDEIVRSDARWLVVSLGFDTYELDGEDCQVTNAAYHEVGSRVGGSGLGVVVLQEGGYYVPDLGLNAVHWLRGAEGRPAPSVRDLA